MNIHYTKKADLKVPRVLISSLIDEFEGKPFFFANDTSTILLDLDAMRSDDEEDHTTYIETLTGFFIALDINMDALMDDVSTLSVYH